MKKVVSVGQILLVLGVGAACQEESLPLDIPEPTALVVSSFISGMKFPLGGGLDTKRNLWVSEIGTGMNDGRVVMVTPSKKVVPVLEGLTSVISNGSVEGLSHIKVHHNNLYVMHGIDGVLYRLSIKDFTEKSAPLKLEQAEKINIRSFVNEQGLVQPLNSNGYDFTIGFGGDLFLTDAGSNSIIRISPTGNLSVFAKLNELENGAEAVPTGIIWDGTSLYVSTLSGYPFTSSAAVVFKISETGVVSVHKTGFTLLSNLELGAGHKYLATQLGVFGASGFGEAEGKVVNQDGAVLAEGFSMPTDLIKIDDRNYYVINYLSGSIDKLSY